MTSNFLVFLISLSLYFIGCIIYCFLNKHRVGRQQADEYGLTLIEPQDIALEALLWPGVLIIFIVLFPYMFLEKLTELLCGQKKK